MRLKVYASDGLCFSREGHGEREKNQRFAI